jgi:hypothetical protein
MSNREFEDPEERELLEWVASQLGITPKELSEQDCSIEEDPGEDDDIYGYNVKFGPGSDPEVLARIRGLQNGNVAFVGFPPHHRPKAAGVAGVKIGPWEVDPLWFVVAGAAWTGAALSGKGESFSWAGEIAATGCVLIIALCLFFIVRRRKAR